MHPEHRSIGELAYHLWQARGCPQGSAEQDWLDAEKQLQSVQRGAELRESEASEAIDNSLQGTFSASDPPASRRADEPPANADAKWKAARAPRTSGTSTPRRSKSTDTPGAKPPS
jgi:hypothetical protein